MKFSIKTLARSAALLLWWGCAQNAQYAGGDDYPNSVNTLGKQAAQERRDTSEWNAYREAPSNAPGLYDTTSVPDTVPSSQAPTVSDTFSISFDSNSNRMILVHIHNVPAFRTVDSTVYQPGLPLDKSLIVSVSGFTRYAGGMEKHYRFEDGDGDGFLSARQQASNIASVHLVTILPSGETQEKNLRLEAGADLNFNAHADNRLLALEQTARKGGDTLSHLLLQDADGDGAIFNPVPASANRVDAQQITSSGTVGVKARLFYRIAAFADSTKNHPVRFHEIVESGGGVQETWALGRDSLPDFAAGDSGWVKTVLTPAMGDTLSQSTGLYSVLLSGTGHFTGNRLLSVNRIRRYRLGGVAQSQYHQRPDTSVADGNFASTGAVTLRLDFTSGKWIQMQGDATSTGISGLVTDSQGRQGVVHFDLQGALKSSSGF